MKQINGHPDEIVHELVKQWESAWQRGEYLSADELCRDVPEYTQELRQAIADALTFERLRNPHQTNGTETLVGRYTLLECVARGATCCVYRAIDRQCGTVVAIKLFNPELLSEQGLASFDREVTILRQLDHDSIAKVVDAGLTDIGNGAQKYLAVQWIDGKPLDEYVFARQLSIEEKVTLLKRVASVVAYLHDRNVLHRDLKPSNVLVDNTGTPWLIDFGIARLFDADSERTELLRTTDVFAGTPAYMSPEQASGKVKQIGPATDVYALGVLAYHILTGKPPIDLGGKGVLEAHRLLQRQKPKPPEAINPKVPQSLSLIVLKALAKLPASRYRNAREFADDLERYLQHTPTIARPPGTIERVICCIRENPLASLQIGGMVALLLFATFVSSYFAWKWRTASIRATHEMQTAIAQRDLANERDRELAAWTYAVHLRQAYRSSRTRPREALAILNDNKRCPVELRDTTWSIVKALTRNRRYVVSHPHPIRLITTAARDDRYLLFADERQHTIIWHLGQQNVVADIPPMSPDRRIVAIAIGEGAEAIAIADDKGFVRTLTQESNFTTGLTTQLDQPAFAVAVRSGGKLLYVNFNGAVCEYDGASTKLLLVGVGMSTVESVIFDRQLEHVVESFDDKIRLSSLRDGSSAPLETVRGSCIAATDDLKELFIHVYTRIRRIQTDSWRRQTFTVEHQPVIDAANCGNRFLAVATESSLSLRSLTDETDFRRYELDGTPQAVRCSSTGKYMCVLGEDGKLSVWNLEPDGYATVDWNSPIRCLVPLNGESGYFSGSVTGRICRWNGANRQVIESVQPIGSPINSMALSPDNRLLVVHRKRGKLDLMDAQTLEIRRSIFPSTDKQKAVAQWDSFVFRNHGRELVIGNILGEIRSIKLASGQVDKLGTIPSTQAIALCPSGDRAAVGHTNGEIAIWQLSPIRRICTFANLPAEEISLFFSEDGTMLAVAADSRIEIWNVASDRPRFISSLQDHGHAGIKLAFSPDGKNVATAGLEGRVILWSINRGVKQLVLHDSPKSVFAITFSKSASQLIAAMQLGYVAFWDFGDKTNTAVD